MRYPLFWVNSLFAHLSLLPSFIRIEFMFCGVHELSCILDISWGWKFAWCSAIQTCNVPISLYFFVLCGAQNCLPLAELVLSLGKRPVQRSMSILSSSVTSGPGKDNFSRLSVWRGVFVHGNFNSSEAAKNRSQNIQVCMHLCVLTQLCERDSRMLGISSWCIYLDLWMHLIVREYPTYLPCCTGIVWSDENLCVFRYQVIVPRIQWHGCQWFAKSLLSVGLPRMQKHTHLR